MCEQSPSPNKSPPARIRRSKGMCVCVSLVMLLGAGERRPYKEKRWHKESERAPAGQSERERYGGRERVSKSTHRGGRASVRTFWRAPSVALTSVAFSRSIRAVTPPFVCVRICTKARAFVCVCARVCLFPRQGGCSVLATTLRVEC